jgi:transketolase
MNHERSIAAIKALAIDATNKAKSGHPGMPIGSAPVTYALFHDFMVSNPTIPTWINRDRFVLSAGHASMLLYAMLHLTGYDVSIQDLQQFRQLHSRTPGHPEVHLTPGVDATTGPLGQGIAQAVGMALAERTLRMHTQQTGLIDHYTYVLSGDGCLQEGISQEAISFAGHQHLNRLILIYDANDVTLDGPLSMSFSEDVKKRFIASGWQVIIVEQGNDLQTLGQAIKKARRSKEKPTMIMIKTIIGEGSKNQGTSKVHGNPLGEEDGQTVKKKLNWPYPEFSIPEDVYEDFKQSFIKRGVNRYRRWVRLLKQTEQENPSWFQSIKPYLNHQSIDIPSDWMTFPSDYKDATRNTSLQIIQTLTNHLPLLVGGSADVAKSVMTTIQSSEAMLPTTPLGRNINFGIREFAMASMQNGMLLHGGLNTFAGTFLAFADYMKPAIRLGALSHIPSIYLFSHDSVALGEDGPTHQPIDQLAMMRAIPNMNVIRPGDANETWGAWRVALMSKTTPTALILTRQNLPLLSNTDQAKVGLGGYILRREKKVPLDYVLVATGSELPLAVACADALENEGKNVRVVSLPSMFAFDHQPTEYQQDVLFNFYDRTISLEALSTFGWKKYAKFNLGIDQFGVSAPGSEAMKHFGFTVELTLIKIKKLLS